MRRSRLAGALAPCLLAGALIGQVRTQNHPVVEDASSIQPERVLDTRSGLGANAGPLVAGVELAVAVPAASSAGATSAVLNLTATDAAGDGWLKAYPCGEAQPATSSLNFTPGRTSANA